MTLYRLVFFFDPKPGQIWYSRNDLPPFKVAHVSRDGDIFVVDANVAFEDCWNRQERWYASDIRQWRDRLAEEKRRLQK